MGVPINKIVGGAIQNGSQTSSSIIQGIIGAVANKRARRDQRKAIGRATATAKQYGAEAEQFQQPYYNQGVDQLNRLNTLQNQGYFDPQQFTNAEQEPDYGTYQPQQFDFQTDPGYQFRQQQGQQAIEGGAASRGLQLSGATQKALARYSGQLASSEYGNAYARYMQNRQQGQNEFQDTRDFLRNKYTTNRAQNYNQFLNQQQQRDNQFNRMSGIASMGQAAGNNLSNIRGGTGSDIGNLQLGLGNVNAGYNLAMGQLGADTARNIGNAQAKTGSDISNMGSLGSLFGGGDSQSGQQTQSIGGIGSNMGYGQQQDGVDYNGNGDMGNMGYA
jgi:hypothetical protein